MAKKSKRTARRKKSFLASRTFLVLAGGTLAVVAAAAAFYAFTGDDAPKRKLRQDPVVTTEMDVTVEVFDNGFEPNDLTVPRGARVTWDFNGDLPHNVERLIDAELSLFLDDVGDLFEQAIVVRQRLHHGVTFGQPCILHPLQAQM